MFGLSPLTPYLIVGFLLSVLGAGTWGYIKGYQHADKTHVVRELEGRLAVQKAAIDALSRDRDRARQVAEVYKRDADLALADMSVVQKLADDYAKELQDRPPSVCTLDERDVRWLRDIAAGRAALGLAPRTPGAAP